jgi:hypothetical protein
MASYTKIVKRYRGGDAIWTNKSNASTIIVNDFFGLSNPEPPTGGSVTVSALSLTSVLNASIAKGSATKIVNTIDSVLSINNATAKGSAFKSVSVIDSSLLLNSVTVKGSANVSTNTIDSILSINNANAIGSAFVQTNTLDSFLELNLVGASGGTVINARVAPLVLEMLLNPVTAFILDTEENEILELNSYITNKILFQSTITNFKLWESYTKVKLTLQSKLR